MKKFLVAFVMLTLVCTAMAQTRSGFYELNPAQTVNIEAESNSIVFNFEAASGEDVFKLRGRAKPAGRNVFEYRKVVQGKTENYDCRIRFTFSQGYLTIKENEDCRYDRFPIVSLDGRYRRD
jgi:hypothetical protein